MMRVYIQDQSSIVWGLEKVYLKPKMELYIWVISKMIYLMDLGLFIFLMAKNTKVNFMKVWNTVLVTIFIKMVTITKDLLPIIWGKVKVQWPLPIKTNIMVNGKIILSMVKVFINTLMVAYIKDNLSRTRKMEMESLLPN